MRLIKAAISVLKKLLFLRIELLTHNILTLLIFEVLYKIVSVFCVYPLIGWSLTKCINIAGFSYIDDSNIVELLCHPVMVIFIIALIVFVAMYMAMEISALLYIFEKSRRKEKAVFYLTVKYGLRNAFRLLKPRNFILYPFLLILMPIFSVGVTSSFLGQVPLPVSFIESILKYPIALLILAVFSIVFLIISFRLVFSMHFFTLENSSGFQSMRKSSKLNRHHKIMNFISMMSIQCVIALINTLLVLVANNLLAFTYDTIASSSFITEIFAFILTVVFFIVYFIVSSLYMPLSCLKISGNYYSNKEKAGESLDSIDLKDEVPLLLGVNVKRLKEVSFTKGLTFKDKCKLLTRKQVCFIVGISVVIVLGVFSGARYICSTTLDIQEQQVETKIISEERQSLRINFEEKINKSKANGACAFYVEIYLTSDGVPVAFSNSNIMTMLDRWGDNIFHMTYAELCAYLDEKDSNSSTIRWRYSLSTLDEIVGYARNAHINLLIDTSSISNPERPESSSFKRDDDVPVNGVDNSFEKVIVDHLKALGVDNGINPGTGEVFPENSDADICVSICSYDFQSLKVFKTLDDKIPTVLRRVLAVGDFSHYKDYADGLMFESLLLSRSQIRLMHNEGYQTVVKCAEQKEIINTTQKFGSDYVLTYSALVANKELQAGYSREFINNAYKRYAFLAIFEDLVC